MFVKNSSSIQKDIIKVDDHVYHYLLQCGYAPLSYDGKWIYLNIKTISSLIDEYEKGGGFVE